jgi:UDP-GlcNAc:undecaprenyl-phosphate/decaprenyl-phosphate GlcNAc-1-phosphate transferase
MNRTAAESCIVAFTLSLLLTPLVRGLCIRFGIFDAPGPLKTHQRPIPRLGGAAIGIAIAAGCYFTRSAAAVSGTLFFVSLALIWGTGLIDDLRGLSPTFRLAAQSAAALLLWRAGWHFPAITNPLGNSLATCVLVILFANSFNWLDGQDGLAAGIAAIAALAFALARTGPVTQFSNGVAWSLFGASAAFLVFNFAPASIFMGDSGSTALGFSFAALTLDFSQARGGTIISLLFPALVAGIPLFDAALAVIRRVRHGESPLKGDRRHFCDLLATRGWSARKTSLVSYATTALMGLVGLIGLRLQARNFAALAGAIFVALFVIGLRLGSLRVTESSDSIRSREGSVKQAPAFIASRVPAQTEVVTLD